MRRRCDCPTLEARVIELLSNSLAAAGPCRDSESSLTFLRCSNSFVGSSGRQLRPRALELAYPRPIDLRPYDDAFGCELRFDAGVNRLTFKRADLIEPLLTSTRAMSELHDTFANDLLERLDNATMGRKVRAQIVRMLPDGEPRRAALAKALGVSERTLQRRLGRENASFHVLLDGTRRELAQEYLANSRLSLAEVAYLLGFADKSNFFRSFKRWFATSPGEFRRRLRTSSQYAQMPSQLA